MYQTITMPSFPSAWKKTAVELREATHLTSLCSFHDLLLFFLPPLAPQSPRAPRLWWYLLRRAACCGSFLSRGNWERKLTLKKDAESKNINILLNINGQGADLNKKFVGELSNFSYCQVVRGKMPLIPSRVKALLILLQNISILERVSV